MSLKKIKEEHDFSAKIWISTLPCILQLQKPVYTLLLTNPAIKKLGINMKCKNTQVNEKTRTVNSYVPLLSGLLFSRLCDIFSHLMLDINDSELVILQQGAAWYAVFHSVARLKLLTM